MTIAERIYSASTSEDAEPARLAERLARLIEDDIASESAAAGGVMGSLRELSERYSVGRAAVREGVALLERRGLGWLRPGPYGGFVVAQPEAETIGGELADFFRMTGVTRTQLADARDAVDLMAAALAAASPGVAGTAAGPVALPGAGDDPIEWHLRTRSALAARSGEPVVQLFVTCLNQLTAEFARPAGSEWQPAAERHAAALREALAAGDADAAMAHTGALNRELERGLHAEAAPLPLPEIETARQDGDRTLATRVARRIAAEVLRGGRAGQRLGSEWDLCERFSVSRATLRQAIRQLEDSGIVECRRGRGNGLVVRDLKGTGSIKLVLAFLISRQMDPQAAGAILFQLNRFVPALAVSRASAAQRRRLTELLARVERTDPIDRYDLLRLVQYVSHLADSPIIDLFSRCLAAYEARFHPLLAERLPRRVQAEYFELLRQLLAEVEPGEAAQLERAKRKASRVMLAMSRNRPI
jgi:DNA-binding FadR family transcriptional regulator